MASSTTRAVTKLSQLSIYRKDPWDKNLLKQSIASQNKQIDILKLISLSYKGNYAKVSGCLTSYQPSLFSVFPLFLNKVFFWIR